ncbi:PREDICTED: putative F-box protein At5g60060 [Nicotiana attenuata]|uniref:putative F-box protein At5g60060 n=1 Tax=Nicotiana attenuata TaxID=49451 RepID=UPI0009055DF4|nr:PREDICTED: putative F-box protein At5g60060 [Nicotiana attenuata]
MDSRSVIPWSDLPKELVERIGKFLDTHIDVLRLRAVCSTWRSSLPPFKNSPSLPLKLQVPIIPYDTDPYSCSPGVTKILLSTNYVWNGTNHFSLMAIHIGGHLCYLKSGDEKWTIIKNASCNIVDIIVYKGNFYAVDQYGETIKFDSSLNETKVASRLYDGGRKTTSGIKWPIVSGCYVFRC